MNKPLVALGAALAIAAVALAATSYTFTVNGKGVALKTIEQNGVVYVEASAAFKALGATVTYDKARHAYTVLTPKPPAAAGNGGAVKVGDVAGTTQLAGGQGAFGQTYSLGKNTLLNFTLNGAEYRLDPVSVGGNLVYPSPEEKLLVLHFTIQNPTRDEVQIYSDSFVFTPVDKLDVSHRCERPLAREGTSVEYREALKPAQKINVQIACPVPAAGPVPKLIVEREDGPVLRYDLRDKAKVPAPWADPADASGATALQAAPVALGQAAPVGPYVVSVRSAAFTTDPMNGNRPDEGNRWLVATINARYAVDPAVGGERFYSDTLDCQLQTAEGDRLTFEQTILKAARDASAETDVKPGDTLTFRVYFPVPEGVGVTALTVGHGNAHEIVANLSGVR